jgi:simple sugar transport system substrate-binding protein
MQQSMLETAQDIGVDFQMTLYDESILDSAEISRAMATDIRNIVVLDNPHALIVSVVGDSLVGRALQSIQDRVPIFVVNALTPTTKHTDALPEFQAAIYMDEEDAAAMVADQIQQNLGNVEIHNKPLGVFINHEPGLPLMTRRYNLLTEATNDAVEWESFELLYSTAETSGNLTSLFDGCNYTVVQLAGERAAEATINALLDNGCDQDSVVIGTYDTSPFVYDAIDAGSLNFAISQQPRIQGSMSVLLASVYATTGQMLVAPSLPILLRPKLTTADNIPYNSNKSKEINIKVLTHDVITDPFWESVYSGLLQAASDFGVNLVTHRFKSAVTGRREVSLEHSFFVQEACQTADIDGLIVSLPHDGMVDALSVCYTRRIPVLAINAAPDESITNELPYVGQQDYYSGFEAGKLLINNGALSGYCVLHANLSSLKERCRGMEDAFADSQETEYQGIIYVSVHATESEYKNIMEMTLGKGNWTGIGVLSTGQIQVPALLSLLQEHPELKAGTFDLGSSVDVPIEKLLFSIDQQPYIQGYLSLAMMKWRAADPVVLKNTRFDTGPKVVFASPSNQKKHCQENGYSICKSKPQLKFSGKCAKLGRLCEVCEGKDSFLELLYFSVVFLLTLFSSLQQVTVMMIQIVQKVWCALSEILRHLVHIKMFLVVQPILSDSTLKTFVLTLPCIHAKMKNHFN